MAELSAKCTITKRFQMPSKIFPVAQRFFLSSYIQKVFSQYKCSDVG